MAETKKIVKYRKPFHLNIEIVIFVIILVYILFYVFSYFTEKHIGIYEVTQGTIAENNTYTGLIVRSESVYTSDYSGTFNYYIADNAQAGWNNIICSVDETGSLAQQLEEMGQGQSVLSDSDLAEIKKSLTSYSLAYNDNRFGNVYDVEYSLESLVMEYSNRCDEPGRRSGREAGRQF